MTDIAVIAADDVAWITEADMIEVDRIMIDDLRIELIQMMENAGRCLAELIRSIASPDRVVVAAGSGGNGGGGLVAARHLANAGVDVRVVTTRAGVDMAQVPAHQLDILERMGIERVASIEGADVVIDSVIGYSLRGAPSGASERLISEITTAGATVISLDTPSGLDVTGGIAPGEVVRADATLTLALPKQGLRHAGADIVGDLYLADISVPPSVTAAFGRPAPVFGSSGLVQISR